LTNTKCLLYCRHSQQQPLTPEVPVNTNNYPECDESADDYIDACDASKWLSDTARWALERETVEDDLDFDHIEAYEAAKERAKDIELSTGSSPANDDYNPDSWS